MTNIEVKGIDLKGKQHALEDATGTKLKISRPFGTSVDNFYITDFISENSVTMSKASKARIKQNLFKEKSIYN